MSHRSLDDDELALKIRLTLSDLAVAKDKCRDPFYPNKRAARNELRGLYDKLLGLRKEAKRRKEVQYAGSSE
jgi:hypothetical protein